LRYIFCEFAGFNLAPEGDGLTYRAEARYTVITQSS
jgi:hypothetical protein